MTTPSTWSDSPRPPQWNADLVSRMVEAGCTARAISVVFGISRDAAIGRMHRDKQLKKLWTKEAARRKPPKKVKPKPMKQAAPADTRNPPSEVFVNADWKDWEEREAKKAEKATVSFAKRPHMLRVPLMNLGANQCRWPVEQAVVTGGYLFCGAATDPFESYCEYHKTRALAKGGTG